MKKIYIILLALFMSLSAGFIPSAQAQEIAPQPCDSEYWRQLSARAWLEAEREIMQNQNLIFKPDSVLEYTCFDQFLSKAAWDGGNIFVHTDYFGKKIIPRKKNESMEVALDAVVFSALQAYRNGNFSYTYLGGRAGAMGAETSNSKFESSKSEPIAYACQTMSKVWKTAKCANFIDNDTFEDTDGFYPFDAIKKHKSGRDVAGYSDTIQETRLFPASLSCINTAGSPPTGGGGGAPSQNLGAAGSWKDQLELANNLGETLYKFQSPLGEIYKEVGKKIRPGECGNPAIPTGVTVIVGEKTHEDGVCTNPGCSFKEGMTCQ